MVRIDITVVYVGKYTYQDRKEVLRDYSDIRVINLDESETLNYQICSNSFKIFMDERYFDFALVEYIEMSFVLPFLNPKTISLLDTHDLVADRILSFKTNGANYEGINLTSEEEQNLLNSFDYVLAIHQPDLEKISKIVGDQRVLLVPHPPCLAKAEIRNEVKCIGFIGSSYLPNVHAIEWFLNEVWPIITTQYKLSLLLCGSVCYSLSESVHQFENVLLYGSTSDTKQFYQSCDIIINPVTIGAGLKIKSMEALGYGLPLVTTTHSSLGLSYCGPKCLLIADSRDEFLDAISNLIADHSLRNRLSSNAHNFIKRFFSEDKCYDPLVRLFSQ